MEDGALVPNRDVRRSMAHSLKLSAATVGVDFKRIRNNSLRPGGESSTFDVGFEMGIIKRWSRRVSATFRHYIWRDEYIVSNIPR